MLHPAVLHAAVHSVRVIHAAGVWPVDSDHDPDNSDASRVRRIIITIPALALIAVVWPMLLAGKNRGPRRPRFFSQIANRIPHSVGDPPWRGDWQRGIGSALWRAMTCATAHHRAGLDEARRIGRNIRGARQEAKLSQHQLGLLIGRSFKRIGDYEHGRHTPPSDVLRAIETALDKPTGYLGLEHPEYNGDGGAG